MGRERIVARAGIVLSALFALTAVVPGCADGGEGGRRDGGGGTLDGSGGDSGGGGRDAFVEDTGPAPDTGVDGGPEATLRTCEACTVDAECIDGYCANLVTGGRACLPGCIPDLPECPRSFSCIFDATGTGVDATICAPIGGPCCVDEDGDGYGQGVGCTDTDCNDTDPEVHPDRTEICDGRDTNCNGTIDEPPTDCEAGLCRATSAGDYEALTSATCSAATCSSGTTTGCGLYTCSGGGEMGTTCATSCANPTTGADDDTFCIASAHCDLGACVPDVVDGGTCNEDSDCSTAHCDSDVCCASGDCCTTTADCPGGGAVTRLCEDPASCQGSRGEATCGTDFRCMVTSGILDDTGCGPTTLAHDCGLYDSIYCDGTATQTPRSCPTSCVADADCIDAAHCEFGFCVPDRPQGLGCTRNEDCQGGLTCADGVCCNTACTGSCVSCNLSTSRGTCTPVPAAADPDGECAGFSCGGYYTGFSATSDVCYRRTDVSDAQAACDGAGMCRSPDVLCATQPPGAIQIDCNDACQSARAGTCTGTVAGACDNLDDPAVRTSCGMGVCMNSVQSCVGGAPQTCTPAGTPVAEVCDGLDNDCNGTVDNGAMCSGPNVTAASCVAGGCVINSCGAGWADVDASASNGCECNVATGASSCASIPSADAITLMPSTSTSRSGAIPVGGERWFQVNFPSSSSPGAGRPRITITAGGATHQLQVTRTCDGTNTMVCSVETAASGTTVTSGTTTDWEWADSAVTPGAGCCTSSMWPSTVYVRIIRTSPPTTCADAQFTIQFGR